jgi:hypothetical protein
MRKNRASAGAPATCSQPSAPSGRAQIKLSPQSRSVPNPDHELTFDEELLLWLGNEPPEVRAADSERIREIAGEFAYGFGALAHVGRAVTVFGSARTPADHPHYALVREVAACLGGAD